MDRRLFIRDFKLQVSIGIHDFEKEAPQTVVVNVDLLLAPAEKPHGDRIANVLNYDTVHDGIVALAKSHFNLQETLVEAILELCLTQPAWSRRVSTETRCLQGLPRRLRGQSSSYRLMSAQTRHLLGAFAAMVFVGAAGRHLPVAKVMLLHFDLLPMAALRTVAATVSLALLLWAVEGGRALRIDLRAGRFLALGFIMAAFFAVYALGLY